MLISKNITLKKAAKYTGIVFGSLIFIFILIIIVFQDKLINTFLKEPITKTFNEANTAYSLKLGDLNYSLWQNTLSCDSIILQRSDSSMTYTAGSFSVGGISWLNILWNRNISVNDLANSTINAQKINIKFQRAQNELQIKSFHVSAEDSLLSAESIDYISTINDEEQFAQSQFRQTRSKLNIPGIKVTRLDFISLLKGKSYIAGNISLHNLSADILVNMDKPYEKTEVKPLMPNEALAAINKNIKIDSIRIINGRLNYLERYAVGAKPGLITFNKVDVTILGIANTSVETDTILVKSKGVFMNSATLNLFMKIPLSQNNFSMQYSGSLGGMNINKLNSFLEPAEFHRVKSGVIHSATFNINVNSGNAGGTLRIAYEDLSIAILNKKSGSENGFGVQLASLLGKIFIIRGTNIPDKNGKMEIGEIKYSRDAYDNFMQFVWFALRSGLADVVGF
jgi:hypothetical protein